MATIIIQGSIEENEKTLKAVKTVFDVVKEKAKSNGETGHMTVLDVYATRFGKEGFSDEQVERALYCCSCKDRLCQLCPYVREGDDCKEKLKIDGGVLIARKLRGASNG